MTDDDFESRNPHRLMRNRTNSVLAGVCAGVADYFDRDVVLVRILALAGLVFLAPVTIMAYLAAALVIPERRGPSPAMSRDQDRFWRGVARQPATTMSGLKYRFRDIDKRLQDLERVVTSNEWRLRRQFRELE